MRPPPPCWGEEGKVKGEGYRSPPAENNQKGAHKDPGSAGSREKTEPTGVQSKKEGGGTRRARLQRSRVETWRQQSRKEHRREAPKAAFRGRKNRGKKRIPPQKIYLNKKGGNKRFPDVLGDSNAPADDNGKDAFTGGSGKRRRMAVWRIYISPALRNKKRRNERLGSKGN